MTEIVEYRVSGPKGLSGRASAILNMSTYPHSREQAERALEAERDYVRKDNLIDDRHAPAGYRAERVNEIFLMERTVMEWERIS